MVTKLLPTALRQLKTLLGIWYTKLPLTACYHIFIQPSGCSRVIKTWEYLLLEASLLPHHSNTDWQPFLWLTFQPYIQDPSTFSMIGSQCLTQGIFTFDRALAFMLLLILSSFLFNETNCQCVCTIMISNHKQWSFLCPTHPAPSVFLTDIHFLPFHPSIHQHIHHPFQTLNTWGGQLVKKLWKVESRYIPHHTLSRGKHMWSPVYYFVHLSKCQWVRSLQCDAPTTATVILPQTSGNKTH